MQPRSALTRRQRPMLVSLVSALALSACATVPDSAGCADPNRDPFEPVNRKIFAFDLALDRAVIKPVAEAYRSVLPLFVRDRIHDVIDNLKQPLVFINDVLQGRGTAAAITAKRFAVNSTIGIGGLTDRATDLGLPRQSGDFGQTLFAWGFGAGPYLVLPLFGPSNVRDALGTGVDAFITPLGNIGSSDVRRELVLSTGVTDGIDLRSRNIESLDELERSSLDFYAYLRSVTRQQRQSVLREAITPPGGSTAPGDTLSDPGTPTDPGAPAATEPLTPRNLVPPRGAADPAANDLMAPASAASATSATSAASSPSTGSFGTARTMSPCDPVPQTR